MPHADLTKIKREFACGWCVQGPPEGCDCGGCGGPNHRVAAVHQKMSFKRWLALGWYEGGATRDLAHDVIHDPNFPRGARRLETIIKYLRCCDACELAIDAAVQAWMRYQESNGQE